MKTQKKQLKIKPKILLEKIVNTDEYAGRVDIITGIDDFEATAEYNDEWHTYRLNGKIIPSVTQLLDDGTFEKLKQDPFMAEKIKYAADKGTLVHKEIEDYLRSNLRGFTDEFIQFEYIYTNELEKFLKEALFDVKTGTVLNKKKTLEQLEYYAEAIKYLTGKEINNLYAIHLPSGKPGKLVKLKGE